jgi:hypothetical protein
MFKKFGSRLNVPLFCLGCLVTAFLVAVCWGVRVVVFGFRLHHGLVGAVLFPLSLLSKDRIASFFVGFSLVLLVSDLNDFPWSL